MIIPAFRVVTNLHRQVVPVPVPRGQLVLEVDYFGLALLVRGYYMPAEPGVGARADFEVEAVYVRAGHGIGVRVEQYLPAESVDTIRDLCVAQARP